MRRLRLHTRKCAGVSSGVGWFRGSDRRRLRSQFLHEFHPHYLQIKALYRGNRVDISLPGGLSVVARTIEGQAIALAALLTNPALMTRKFHKRGWILVALQQRHGSAVPLQTCHRVNVSRTAALLF